MYTRNASLINYVLKVIDGTLLLFVSIVCCIWICVGLSRYSSRVKKIAFSYVYIIGGVVTVGKLSTFSENGIRTDLVSVPRLLRNLVKFVDEKTLDTSVARPLLVSLWACSWPRRPGPPKLSCQNAKIAEISCHQFFNCKSPFIHHPADINFL